jgi:DNA-directed RNA polymerase alpha subunit
MAEIKILIEFIVAVVSAYFLMKIENVKQQKDIGTLQVRVSKLEEKIEEHEQDTLKDLKEIKEMLHELQIQIIKATQNRRHEP